jgi:hypothetical protein
MEYRRCNYVALGRSSAAWRNQRGHEPVRGWMILTVGINKDDRPGDAPACTVPVSSSVGFKVLMAKNVIDNLSEETRKGMLEKA